MINKINNIPAGWVVHNLGYFIDFKNGVNASKESYGKGVKFVNVMDVFRSNILKKNLVTGSVEISDNQKKEFSVKYGDILFNRTSETSNEIAYSSVYIDNEAITFGGFVIRGRQKIDMLSPNYVKYCFKDYYVRKDLIRKSQGVVRSNIGQKDLNKVSILIPPKTEQKAIASVLEKWDEAIEKTSKLIEAKKKRFKWLKHQFFENALKNWNKETLENVGDFYNGLSGKNKNDFGSGEKYLTYMNIFSNSKINILGFGKVLINENENQNLVQKGDIFFTVSSETSKEVGMTSVLLDDIEDCYLNSFCFGYRLKDSNYFAIEYLQYFLRSSLTRKQISRLAQGSTRFNISKSFLSKIYIYYPPLSQQKQIAKTLNTAKKEITILEEILAKYKNQKIGLMQKLLTGKVRVNNINFKNN
jgi:type I restriction enzyme S subunit